MANKVPLGDFKPMTDDEIDEFSQVSTEDIELLRSAWKKYVASRFADLIDAGLVEDTLDLDAAS